MPTTGLHYIGRVKRAPHRLETYHYATLEPLIESESNGTQWAGRIRDVTTRFPNRGLVHWHGAPLTLQSGTLLQFTTFEHPSERPEQFQSDDPQESIEVIDLRAWNDESLLRSTITGDGVALSPAPLARRVLLWLASGICVGPLLLKNGTASGLWVLDNPEAHRDAARMPIHRLSNSEISRVSLDGARWFVSPRVELAQPAGIQNWTSDSQVARSVLGRLRKMDPDLGKAVGVTDTVFREYLDRVEASRMGSADPAVERARADRLRGFRDAIQRDRVLLTEAADALLTTEAVRTEVERQVQFKVDEQVGARQGQITDAIAVANTELINVQKELETKRAKRNELDAAILAKQSELEKKVSSFDEAVTTKLNEISLKPAAFFAEAAVMRTVLASLSAQSFATGDMEPSQDSPVGASASPKSDSNAPVAGIGQDAALRAALWTHASAGALSIHAMLALHAAFVSGVVPVLTGARGYDLVHAYAAAVAGGRLHWIPVGSSTMEPHDLLGRFDPSSRHIAPSPSGLLDVLRDAKQSGRLHVVVLEGFNRAPVEGYLLPILEVAQAARVGDAARTIPIAAGITARDDPYRALGRLVWPPNVVVACLPRDGTSTLPLPGSAWRFLGLLDADDRDRPPMPSAHHGSPAPACTEIAASFWNDIVASARAYDSRDLNELTALARALLLTAHDAADTARLREVMRLNELPDTEATGLAVGTIMITRCSVEAKVIEDSLRTAGIALTGWRTLVAETLRLRQ